MTDTTSYIPARQADGHRVFLPGKPEPVQVTKVTPLPGSLVVRLEWQAEGRGTLHRNLDSLTTLTVAAGA